MIGATIGVMFASGMLVVISRVLATRPPSLATQVAPFVPALNKQEAHSLGPLSTLWLLFKPSTNGLRRRDSKAISLRLARAGRPANVQRYRLEQIAWGVTGGLIALVIVVLTSSMSTVALIFISLGVVFGVVCCDKTLSWQITKRQRRLVVQLPMVADLVAFSVAAGESMVAALERLSRSMSGDLPNELARCVADIRDGSSLEEALRGVAQRCDTLQITRFIDGIIVALERGTPIAEIMRAQAADARSAEQRRLMEIAGRKDVIMLMPIVFLILPTVVLIAVYPGLYSFDLFIA